MYIVNSYPLAVALCFITMLCWGSWGNTQKLAERSWRFEYFYWDYVTGIVIFSLFSAVTLGSIGEGGRSFLADFRQAKGSSILLAFTGGVVFNAANILLSAAIAICGMSVAFPVGIGLALVLGVLVNYFGAAQGQAVYLFLGVSLISLAILFSGMAYGTTSKKRSQVPIKGILLSVVAGSIMAFFYRFVAASMDLEHFDQPAIGKMTPYTAVVVFSMGVFTSNFPFNFIARLKPVAGTHIPLRGYFSASPRTHLVGIAGGCIWCLGQLLSLLASGKAGTAISYGLGQGATLVSACWGIFVWKEFRGAPPAAHRLNIAMFIFFLAGLGLLIYAGA